MANATQCYKQDETGEYKPVKLWLCSSCNRVSVGRDVADKCCTCLRCGCSISRTHYYCQDCEPIHRMESFERRAEKATRCEPSDNVECWYDDWSNRYYFGPIEEVLTEFDADSMPDVLYFCTEHRVRLDADAILQNVDENSNVEDGLDLDGRTLQPILDKWVEDNASHVVWYEEDYSRCVETAKYAEQPSDR